MSQINTIYVKLLDEGVDVWRPVEAEHIDEMIYKILPQIYDRASEQWEFEPEKFVECAFIVLDKEKVLVAVKSHGRRAGS